MTNKESNGKGNNEQRYNLAINSLGKLVFQRGEEAMTTLLSLSGDIDADRWSSESREAIYQKMMLCGMMQAKEDINYINKQLLKIAGLMENLEGENDGKP
jgi:hypothetical protein